MPIFKTQNGKLVKLSILSISKEKELQTLVEANLDEVMGMHFLATEYTTTSGGRIDTLAVDYTGAPVIIEYKKICCKTPVYHMHLGITAIISSIDESPEVFI